MATTIDYTNLLSEPWQNVYDIINDRTKVADPAVGSTSQHREFVYTREPDLKTHGFKKFPYIIVNPAEVNFEEGGSVDGKSKFVNWTVLVEVVAGDRGHNNRKGNGASDCDTVSNRVIQQLMDITNRQTMGANRAKFIKPDAVAMTTEALVNTLVYRRAFIVPMRTRLQVSA